MSGLLMFDMDGVIADSWQGFYSSWSSELNKKGLSQWATERNLLDCFDGNFFKSIQQQLPEGTIDEQFMKAAEKNHISFMTECPMYPGISDALTRLSEKHSLYLVTSNFREAATRFLDQNNITVFEDILGAEDGYNKTDKIHSIMAKHPDKNHYFLSDTLGDLIEAKAAGASLVAVGWGWHSISHLKKPALIFCLTLLRCC